MASPAAIPLPGHPTTAASSPETSMTAATADLETPFRPGNVYRLPLAAGVLIFAGTLVCIDPGDSCLAKDPEDGSAIDGWRFAGVAAEAGDNSDGADNAEKVAVHAGDVHKIACVCSPDDVGRPVYLIDNATVGLAETSGVHLDKPVGTIDAYIDGAYAWVAINDHRGMREERPGRQFQVTVAGPNADDFDLTSAAAQLGGSDFYIESVVSALAIVASTGAPATPMLKGIPTTATLSGGVLTAVGDESANLWIITFIGRLVR